MLIIAKKSEKDYYDGVIGTMGVDKTIVYDRELIELENDKRPEMFKRHPYWWSSNPHSSFLQLNHYNTINKNFRNKYDYSGYFIVGFCGKLYVGWKLYREVKKLGSPFFKELTTEFTYDFDYIKQVIKTKSYHGNLEDLVYYVNSYDSMWLFRDFKAPVFVYDDDYGRTRIENDKTTTRFAINPLLKDYEFYKVFDAFQTFQEVMMFMGGVLGHGEKDIVEVADKYKITQHGFDYKWSFRKKPEKNGKI